MVLSLKHPLWGKCKHEDVPGPDNSGLMRLTKSIRVAMISMNTAS